MRWIFRSFAAFALLFCIYAASPYAALYGLAKAVEGKDVAAINDRVNFQAVRQSLSKQIVAAYLRATGKGGQPDSSPSPFAGMAAGAGASIVDPLIAPLVTADALMNVLENGWPAALGGLASGGSATGGVGEAARRFSLDPTRFLTAEGARSLFMAAESRGFRVVLFGVPFDQPASERIKLQFRLSNLNWRLVGIELPEAIRARVAEELIKKNPSAT